MPFYVYIVLCRGGSFYTGYTKNVEERVRLHSNGRGSKYTKMYPPKKVAYVEELETRSEAMKREKAIKKLSHDQKQKLIKLNKLRTAVFVDSSKSAKIEATTNRDLSKMGKKISKKRTWNDKLAESKGLPKIEPIGEKMSLKWGKGTLVIPAPLEVDELMGRVPEGKVTTINEIRSTLALRHGATIACPMTTGIFSWIAAYAADEKAQSGQEKITPYWRTLKTGGFLNEKYPGGTENQKHRLEAEGHTIIFKGKKCVVANYESVLVRNFDL